MITDDGTSTIEITAVAGHKGGTVRDTSTNVVANVTGTGDVTLKLQGDGFGFNIPPHLVGSVHDVLSRCLSPETMKDEAHVLLYADGTGPGPAAKPAR